jgi:tetratricopeptide (TPR) repeat protein
MTVAEQAINLCAQEGDDVGLARAWRVVAWINGRACRYGAAAEAFERAIDHARRAGDVRQERRASVQYVQAAVFGPTPVDEAIVSCQEVVKRVEGDRQAGAVVVCVLGQLEAMRGNFDRARELYGEAFVTLEELGLPVDAATVSFYSGRVELLAGDAEAAERDLRDGYDYFSRLGERYLLSSVAGLLAEALANLGRIDEAEALSLETEALSAEDDVDAQTLWRTARARVLAARGELVEAEALARDAVELLEPTDDVLNQVNAYACLASALLVSGQEHEARQALSRAQALAEAKRSPVMLARLRELEAVPAPARSASV